MHAVIIAMAGGSLQAAARGGDSGGMHGGLRGVARRTVSVDVGAARAIGVVEVADWDWWERESAPADANPFGAKLWPAAVAIAQELSALPPDALRGVSVLELGCGNGLCSLTAALLGASPVVATDVSADALTLTTEAARAMRLPVETRHFDLGGREPLPPADLVIAADLLYDETLAAAVAVRTLEAAERGSWVLVADGRRGPRSVFLRTLRERAGATRAAAYTFELSRTVRLAQVGWKEKHVDVLSLNAPPATAASSDDESSEVK